MRLHEYQSKEIFRQYGIPTPRGVVCTSTDEAVQAVEQFGSAAIKAQVLVGGRGKAGGIILARPDSAAEIASRIFGMTIKGLPVTKVLVEESVDIVQEFYVAIALDRSSRRPLLMASASGGVDIEEVARTSPEHIIKESIDPGQGGPQPHQLIHIAEHLGLQDFTDFPELVRNLYTLYDQLDCTLSEINPMVLTRTSRLVALDAKLNIDDNALFRQEAMEQLYQQNLADLDPLEVQARELGMSYVALDGSIGCIVNGAGLALATLDMITRAGGAPANFMDVRGGADARHVGRAVEITTSNPATKVLLINMFGGLTLCDEIAEGIRNNLEELDIPVVIRLTGTNQEQGWKILEGAKVTVAHSTDEAARIAVEMVS
ncbi:MAG: ADP-forming succinate--CoA ligase subunit beta [Methanosarcinales archaeon]|nr:ADP-forming succinate--CoA ligase subunit beta [Methanosarcinales archaeon]